MLKLLSTYRGEIKRLLLIDRVETQRQEDDVDILSRFRGLIEALSFPEHEEVVYEIVVQYQYKPKLSDAEVEKVMQGSGKEIVKFHWSEQQSENVDEVLSVNTNSPNPIQPRGKYRIIYSNLDVSEIIKQIPDTEESIPEFDDRFSVWIRDHFMVLEFVDSESRVHPVFLEPYFPWPHSKPANQRLFMNQFLPEILSSTLDVLSRSIPYVFQGGNIVAGDNYAVASELIYWTNRKLYKKQLSTFNFEAFWSTFARAAKVDQVIGLGREFLNEKRFNFRGKSAQLVFYHLDLFMTLLGPLSDSQELAFIATLYTWQGGDWKPISENDNDYILEKFLDKYQNELSSARPLESKSFVVKRIPALWHRDILYSYNNCLIENPSTTNPGRMRKRIYYPQYYWDNLERPDDPSYASFMKGDKIFEDEIKRIANDLEIDIEMRPVAMGFRAMAMSHAGLTCITSVLERTNPSI